MHDVLGEDRYHTWPRWLLFLTFIEWILSRMQPALSPKKRKKKGESAPHHPKPQLNEKLRTHRRTKQLLEKTRKGHMRKQTGIEENGHSRSLPFLFKTPLALWSVSGLGFLLGPEWYGPKVVSAKSGWAKCGHCRIGSYHFCLFGPLIFCTFGPDHFWPMPFLHSIIKFSSSYKKHLKYQYRRCE